MALAHGVLNAISTRFVNIKHELKSTLWAHTHTHTRSHQSHIYIGYKHSRSLCVPMCVITFELNLLCRNAVLNEF